MALDQQKLKTYYNALHVQTPVDYSDENERKKYVEGLHGDKDVVTALFRAIDFQDGQGVFLFSGQRGSGKSTELKRLKFRIETEVLPKAKVYYLDMTDWLNPNRPLELGSFVVSVVAAWSDQLGTLHTQQSPAGRFWHFLSQTKVNIDHLKIEAGTPNIKAALQLSLQTDDSFLSEIATAIKGHRTTFIAQAKQLISEIVADICPNGEKCILLIDSLEKVSGVGDSAEAVLSSVLSLFSQNSDALQLPRVHAVYSIAPYVMEHNKNLPSILGGATYVQLPSVHVFQRDSNTPDPVGIDRVVDLITRRCPDWKEFIKESDLRQLITDAGGDLRDLMRALQNCFISLTEETPQVSSSALEFARSQIRPTVVIPIEHMVWMDRINQTHRPEVSATESALVLEKYLNTKHILAYLNGQTWYGIHPLIREQVREQVKRHDESNASA
jgi:hypothetical protein